MFFFNTHCRLKQCSQLLKSKLSPHTEALKDLFSSHYTLCTRLLKNETGPCNSTISHLHNSKGQNCEPSRTPSTSTVALLSFLSIVFSDISVNTDKSHCSGFTHHRSILPLKIVEQPLLHQSKGGVREFLD